ncbi:hypothetical protein RSAG8_04169, partial [Rhizoctonia solani AG-8 WAC10335]
MAIFWICAVQVSYLWSDVLYTLGPTAIPAILFVSVSFVPNISQHEDNVSVFRTLSCFRSCVNCLRLAFLLSFFTSPLHRRSIRHIFVLSPLIGSVA